MVLGDQGSDIAYANDNNHILAFHISTGSTAWMYTAPSTGLNLIAAVSGGGLVATSTCCGANTVLRFDATGNLTTDGWSALGLDYYIGNLWTGFPLSGGIAEGFHAAPVQFSNSSWFASNPVGPELAPQDVTVASFSQAGPNQTTITRVLGEILMALPLTAFPGSASCDAWVGSGPAGTNTLTNLQTLLTGPPSAWGHAVVNVDGRVSYTIGAFTGAINTDGTSTGIPAGILTTVNDSGEFFNSNFPNLKPYNGQPHLVGIPKYPGTTLTAQATVLLHELGHALTLPGFQHDNGVPNPDKAEIWNDGQVNTYCRRFIEALPSIASLSPTSGVVGASVTITGTNFGASQSSNTVTFGGSSGPILATITSWNTNGKSIVVTVPSGATNGNIVINIAGVPTTGPIFTVLP